MLSRASKLFIYPVVLLFLKIITIQPYEIPINESHMCKQHTERHIYAPVLVDVDVTVNVGMDVDVDVAANQLVQRNR